eukprot:TRINITY_DN3480_c1_g1_i1.p1 TRINITY_DN3480_c1_g1~~TRINITY_DN3480_c1_g1_i1.p1  ORF type:complete len:292 (+),score=84.09 TRINITY_DN3480_c1_g1_i1:79-954(+)
MHQKNRKNDSTSKHSNNVVVVVEDNDDDAVIGVGSKQQHPFRQRYCHRCSRLAHSDVLISTSRPVTTGQNQMIPSHGGDLWYSMGRKGRWNDAEEAFKQDEVWCAKRSSRQVREAGPENDGWSQGHAFRHHLSPKQQQIDELRLEAKQQSQARLEQQRAAKRISRRDHHGKRIEQAEYEEYLSGTEAASEQQQQQQQQRIKKRGRGIEPHRADWAAEADANKTFAQEEHLVVLATPQMWRALPCLDQAAQGLKMRDTRVCSCRNKRKYEQKRTEDKGGRRKANWDRCNDDL